MSWCKTDWAEAVGSQLLSRGNMLMVAVPTINCSPQIIAGLSQSAAHLAQYVHDVDK